MAVLQRSLSSGFDYLATEIRSGQDTFRGGCADRAMIHSTERKSSVGYGTAIES
jgi:hypothetical protein